MADSHSIPVAFVPSGLDRYGENHSLGVSEIAFKVAGQGEEGTFILENTFHVAGGPARHLHFEQDEWFYIVEGEFVFEVGEETFRLRPGDSLLAPRRVPHVWAFDGSAPQGRIIVAFFPAGKMEAFFRKVTPAQSMPKPDPDLWRAHGMELLGPPLKLP